MLPYVERDLKVIAARVLEKSKQICEAKSVLTIHMLTSIYFCIDSIFGISISRL